MIEASLRAPRLFSLVFDRHFDAVYAFLRRQVPENVADDIAAETFVQAFERRCSYDGVHPDARPWLFGIAVNLLRRHWRQERRESRAWGRVANDTAAEGDGNDDVHERLDAEIARPWLRRALEELSDDDRNTLLLYAWADLSYAEVALALGVPVGTVRSRLSRVRRQIGELINDTTNSTMRDRNSNDPG